MLFLSLRSHPNPFRAWVLVQSILSSLLVSCNRSAPPWLEAWMSQEHEIWGLCFQIDPKGLSFLALNTWPGAEGKQMRQEGNRTKLAAGC